MTESDKNWLTTEFLRVHDKLEYLPTLAKRVRVLEQDKWKRAGITIAVSSGFSIAIALLGFYLKFKL